MEFTNNPRSVNPRPVPGGRSQPPVRRAFTDFGGRPVGPTPINPTSRPLGNPQPITPAAQPVATPLKPMQHPAPAPARPMGAFGVHSGQPQHHQQPHRPLQPQHMGQQQQSQHTPRPAGDIPHPKPNDQEIPQHASKKGRHLPHQTAHSGLVGFICFVVLGGLLLSPFLPGKILDDFLLSSRTISSGEQSFACIADMHNVQSQQKYTLKLGWPVTYKYNAETTRTGDCNGKSQTITGDRMGQFNPLGLLMNLAGVLVVAIIVAKVWRKIFSPKD